mgnify:FL=1
MAEKRPLVFYDSIIEEIHDGDTLSCEIGLSSRSSDGQVIFNDDGLPTGHSGLTYDSTTSTLTVSGAVNAGSATLTTPLAVVHGGTGATTAQDAINTLTQAASATNGQVLTANGAGDAVWADLGQAHVIEGNGTPVTQRDTLNFTTGLTVTDETTKTTVAVDCSVTAAANKVVLADSTGKIDTNWLPNASTTQRGLTILSNAVNTDEDKAATPRAVNTLYATHSAIPKRLALIFG